MISVHNPSTLLGNYYSHSYGSYGMHIPATVLESALKPLLAQIGSGVEDSALRSLRSQFAVSDEAKSKSHIARVLEDMSWLKGTAASSALEGSILDFGSGNESETRLTSRVINARLIVAIDPRLKDVNLHAAKNIQVYRHLPNPGELPPCDLVLMRHVLHHVPAEKQEGIIRHLPKLGSRGTFICLVEDCVDQVEYDLSCKECRCAQDTWNAATRTDRRKCLELNDIWSNCVAYSRSSSDQWHSFRTESEWIECLSCAGYVIEDCKRSPFGHARLHGVPKLFLLARQK